MASQATPAQERIEFRISPDAKKQIEQAAHALGRSLTDFAKDTLTTRARAVLNEHSAIKLSKNDREAFLEMLGMDPEPNLALLRAARLHGERVVRRP